MDGDGAHALKMAKAVHLLALKVAVSAWVSKSTKALRSRMTISNMFHYVNIGRQNGSSRNKVTAMDITSNVANDSRTFVLGAIRKKVCPKRGLKGLVFL